MSPIHPLSTIIRSAACRLRFTGPRVSAGLVTCEGLQPRLVRGGHIRVGRLALRAITAPVELGAAPGGRLVIGDRVFVNSGATIVAHHSIEIGDDARIGDLVAIYDTDHHPLEDGADADAGPVSIERNAWLGRGVIVLPGVTVGESAVVAAGSVVTGDVAPLTLVAGNPARPVRELNAPPGWRRP